MSAKLSDNMQAVLVLLLEGTGGKAGKYIRAEPLFSAQIGASPRLYSADGYLLAAHENTFLALKRRELIDYTNGCSACLTESGLEEARQVAVMDALSGKRLPPCVES